MVRTAFLSGCITVLMVTGKVPWEPGLAALVMVGGSIAAGRFLKGK